jgi:hypothetical protein
MKWVLAGFKSIEAEVRRQIMRVRRHHLRVWHPAFNNHSSIELQSLSRAIEPGSATYAHQPVLIHSRNATPNPPSNGILESAVGELQCICVLAALLIYMLDCYSSALSVHSTVLAGDDRMHGSWLAGCYKIQSEDWSRGGFCGSHWGYHKRSAGSIYV